MAGLGLRRYRPLLSPPPPPPLLSFASTKKGEGDGRDEAAHLRIQDEEPSIDDKGYSRGPVGDRCCSLLPKLI